MFLIDQHSRLTKLINHCCSNDGEHLYIYILCLKAGKVLHARHMEAKLADSAVFKKKAISACLKTTVFFAL